MSFREQDSTLQEKVKGYADIIRMKEIEKMSYSEIGVHYGVSATRARQIYGGLIWLREHENDSLWKVLSDYCKDVPAAHVKKLYTALHRGKIKSLHELRAADEDTLKKIRGIGTTFRMILLDIKVKLNEE